MNNLLFSIICAVMCPLLVLTTVYSIKAKFSIAKVKEIMFTPDIKKVGVLILMPLCILTFYFLKKDRITSFNLLQIYMLISFCTVCALTDINDKLIYNKVLLYMLLFWVLTIVPMLFIKFSEGLRMVILSLLGFFVGGIIFLFVYIISKKSLGAGDVKLISIIGLYVTAYHILSVVFYSAMLASIGGITLIVLKKIDKKGTMPFAPFILMGVILTLFLRV